MMHGNRAERGRSENDVNRDLQAWARLRSLQHRVQHHLKIPGPRGVLARQLIEMSEILEHTQLERVW